MKRILPFLFLINLTITCAQTKSENIIGEWKIISVNSRDFYLNTKADSISLSKEFKEVFKDSMQLENIINVAKMNYNNNVMEFIDSGVFNQKINDEIRLYGTYEINPSIKKINVLLKNKVNWEMEYELVENQLHLTTTVYKKKSEFVLERVKIKNATQHE